MKPLLFHVMPVSKFSEVIVQDDTCFGQYAGQAGLG